jgi:hypothetical protein
MGAHVDDADAARSDSLGVVRASVTHAKGEVDRVCKYIKNDIDKR